MNILGFSITRSKNIDADLAIFQKAMVEHMESGSLVKGRSSENTTVDFMSSLLNESQAMKPEFNIEVLRICNYLAKHNSDISYAVDNIVQLGNTPENITFDDGVSADQAKEMIKYLNVYEKSIYAGGMNSLKNDLFAQLAITGAVSLEAIPKRDMSGLDKVVLVDPYHIRFIYNDSTYSYDPYQKLPDKLGYKDDLHKLNTDQYKYYALRRMSDSPYAIPPFMAAFEGLELEKDMLKNMRNIIRKLGIFGILSVMLTPPRRKQNETDAQFTARCTQYLENIRPEVEKGYAGGMAMGFEGQTKYNIEASTTNVSGASDVMDIITRRVHAGLKQDSLMLNQNFNVAETMSRVIMAKLTTQVGNYQRSVGTVVSDVRLMALKLAGYSVESVYTEYESAMIGDKLRDEQAYAAKIKNRMQLRDMGIISQQDMAQEVGYEEPHAERNVDYTVPSLEKQAQGKQAVPKDPTNPATTVDPAQAQDPTASGATAYNATLLYHRIHRGADEFDYGDECTCGECDHVISYAKDKDKKKKPNIDDAIALYQSDVNYEYRQLIDRASLRIVSELEGIGNGVTAEQLTDKVFYILYSEWDATFNQAQQKHIKKWVRNIYDIFRRDSEGIFGTATDVKPSFDLFDIRALQYFEDSDNFYLGKFITDTDTRRAVTEFVKQAYLVDGTPIGKNPQAIENFKDGFRELMYLEDWKIRRIIDTSVNRMRNTGALSYMQQAGVTSFKRIGIRSANQCQYCAHMDGQVFSVQEAYTAVEKAMHGQPQAIKYDLPFVTSVYGGRDGVERFKQLAPAQIQASGIHIPPSHGHCRCVIVAVL